MRQKFWSWCDDYVIKDADGRDVYFIDGRAFSWGDSLSFQDMEGHELMFIRQKLLSWGPTYHLERDGRVCAEVRKHLFTFLRCRFSIDVPGPDDLEAAGNFTDHEYTFERGGQCAAMVSKQWFTWTDTYGVDIANGEDELLILAATVVIDLVCHGDRHQE
jgi:uncharacterized protein YxjI